MNTVTHVLCSGRNCVRVATRSLTANEAAVALRPFYFLVHPDRYAKMPQVREQNEKSLQIFNGYLNDLYPTQPSFSSHRPIEVCFSILNKDQNVIEDVKISLSGTDPRLIVRNALEKCRLCTQSLSRTPSPIRSPHVRMQPAQSQAPDLMAVYLRRKKKQPPPNDLIAILTKNRDLAIQKSKEFEVTKQTLKDDIDDLKWRTGVKDIIWQMDWAETHMRRCVHNVQRLLDQADSSTRETLLNAVYKTTLRFGRGSFICCDGSLQFGADHVPEQWQQVCEEATVRRAQLPVLHSTTAALRELFGGATVITPLNRGLAQTIQQLHSLSLRIRNREPELQKRIHTLGGDSMLEVMSSYNELSVGFDGRLFIPCNVDIPTLADFLQENAQAATKTNENMLHILKQIEVESSDCCRELGVYAIDWENNLQMSQLLQSIRRLRDASPETRELIKGLHVRFSANPNIFVMSDGKLSVPLNWV